MRGEAQLFLVAVRLRGGKMRLERAQRECAGAGARMALLSNPVGADGECGEASRGLHLGPSRFLHPGVTLPPSTALQLAMCFQGAICGGFDQASSVLSPDGPSRTNGGTLCAPCLGSRPVDAPSSAFMPTSLTESAVCAGYSHTRRDQSVGKGSAIVDAAIHLGWQKLPRHRRH